MFRCLLNEYPEKIDLQCSERPTACQENATFLINCEKLGSSKDILADDLGVFKYCGVKRAYFRVRLDKDEASILQKYRRKPEVLRLGTYQLKRSYWSHADYPSFKRRLCELYDHDSKIIKHCLLQYSFEGTSPMKIRPKPHQNATSKEAPYSRTSSSTLNRITSKLQLGKTPSQTFDEVFEEGGGLLEVKTMSDVPKDRQQKRNLKRSLSTPWPADKDKLFSLIERAKNDDVVRVIKVMPEPLVVVYTNEQLEMMKKYCRNAQKFSIFGIDATFKLGDFLVTPTTFRHLQLTERESLPSYNTWTDFDSSEEADVHICRIRQSTDVQ